ncbi:MAG: EamA family transporter [Planctomycetes bacterium]|nr:EamA family transporter [Planctomycetota bacterium]
MRAILLAVAAGLCWGVGELCTKSVLHGGKIGPLTAIAVRSTVALPVIWLAWVLALQTLGTEPKPAWRELTGAEIAKLVVGSGLVAGALAMICFYSALALDDISRIKPIAFTLAPATAALLGWMLMGETMTWRKALALVLILGGVLLLTSDRPRAASPGAGEHAPLTPR